MENRPAVAQFPGIRRDRAFGGQDLRNALGMYATGVTIVTARGASGPYGMTANSFTGVSLDPPLVLVCAASRGRGAAIISASGHFAVNVLAAGQEAISRRFASRHRTCGGDAFRGVPHRRLVTGAPIIDGVAAYLDCSLAAVHPAGDHTIFVGEVLALGSQPSAGPPLIFFASRYLAL